jgi:hypothetical protein
MLLYGLHQSIQGLALSGGQISNLIVARNGALEHVGGRRALQKPSQARTDSIQRRLVQAKMWSSPERVLESYDHEFSGHHYCA